MKAQPMDVSALAAILRDEGWDVVVDEDVIARRERQGVWHLYADRSGRLRLEVTRQASMPRGERIHHMGREYRVLWEMHEVINVLTTISQPDELVEVLHALEDIVHRRLWEAQA